MSQEHDSPIKTPKQLALVILGAFVVPVLIIMLVVKVITPSEIQPEKPEVMEAAQERLAPAAVSELRDSSAARTLLKGEDVYQNNCAACHTSGAAGAPKMGDKGAWGARLGKGLDGLTASAIKGKGAMPARGGNPDLADEEIKRAIAFMANKSGASFKVAE
jgi:cytochrome c5